MAFCYMLESKQYLKLQETGVVVNASGFLFYDSKSGAGSNPARTSSFLSTFSTTLSTGLPQESDSLRV